MTFLLLWLTLLCMTLSRSIHVAAKSLISFFFSGWVTFHCMCVPHLFNPLLCQWTFRLLRRNILKGGAEGASFSTLVQKEISGSLLTWKPNVFAGLLTHWAGNLQRQPESETLLSRAIPSERLHPEQKSLLPPLGPRSTWLVLSVILLRVCPVIVPSDHLKRGSWLIHSQEAILDHQLHPAPRLSLSHHPVLCRKHSSLLPLVFAHLFIDFFFSE